MYDQIDQNQDASEGHDSGGTDRLKGGVVQRKGDGPSGGSTRDIAAAGFSGPTMDLPYRSEMEAGFVAQTPLGRAGHPTDIADVVTFLASDDSRWLTGENITASGGIH